MIIQSLIIYDKSVKLKHACRDVYFPSLYLEISLGTSLGHRGQPSTRLLVMTIMECKSKMWTKENDNIKLALNMLLLYHSQVNTDCAVQWLRKKWHHQRKDWFHVNLACTMLVMLSLTNYFTKEVHLPLSNQKRKTHCFPSRYPQVTVGKRIKKKRIKTHEHL